MKKCINCGTELDDKALFCIECGTKQPPQGTKCIQCGAELQPGAKFCTECGAKQVAKKRFCANCGAELTDGMKFCVECGTPAQEHLPISSTAKSTITEKEVVSNTSKEPEEEEVVDIDCNYKAECDDNDMYGFIDDDGNWVIEPQFDDADDFCGGFATVKIDDEWGYIKPDGSYLVKPKFSFVDDFSEGFARVRIDDDDEMGYIKSDGSYLIEPKFEDAGNFSEGLAAVKINDKWGYIKPNGSYAIKPMFEYAYGFCEGFARVEMDRIGTNGHIGFIRADGSYLAKTIFFRAQDFSNGKAKIRISDEDDNIIDGELFVNGTIVFNDGERTDVDQLYDEMISYQEDEEDEDDLDEDNDNDSDDSEDKHESSERKLIPFEDPDDGKWGYKYPNGDIALLAMFDYAEEFDGDYARVELCSNEMFIDRKGNLCHDRNGSVYEPTHSKDTEDEREDYNYEEEYSTSKSKKSFVGKMFGAAVKGLKNLENSSSSSSRSPKKEIRKVWVCTYKGRNSMAPSQISVPSMQQIHKPTADEIVEVLMNMGYSKSQAISIRGADQDWTYK